MLHLIAIAAAVAAAAPAAPVPLSPAVKKDVHCFMLFAAEVDGAKEDKVRQAAGLGVEYYLGRIDVAAPGLDLARVVREEGAAFDRDPDAMKAVAATCDSEFTKRNQDLMNLGKDLQKTTP
jgi:hypothetical protein